MSVETDQQSSVIITFDPMSCTAVASEEFQNRVIPQYCPKIGVFKINFFFLLKGFFHLKQFSVLQRPYMKEIKKDKKKIRICHPSQKL